MAHTLLHSSSAVGNRCIPRVWHRVSFLVLPLSGTHFNVETDVADVWRGALFTSECLRGTRRQTSRLTEDGSLYPLQPKPEAASVVPLLQWPRTMLTRDSGSGFLLVRMVFGEGVGSNKLGVTNCRQARSQDSIDFMCFLVSRTIL